ncbi:MAG: Uma2 family endonuclease [Singulisphaera sp.]
MATLNPPAHDRETELDPLVPPPGPMTEEEFVAWCDEAVKAEWVDGEVIIMSPASLRHVNLVDFLITLMRMFAEHHDSGLILGPEFQVRLGARRRRRVPDVLFVARPHLENLRTNHLEGAPDLAMEIVSPDSVARDWREKYLDYQAAGVREYWVIDPLSRNVEADTLTEEVYRRIEEADGRIASLVLPGFFLRPAWLWQEPLPRVRDVLQELARGVDGDGARSEQEEISGPGDRRP